MRKRGKYERAPEAKVAPSHYEKLKKRTLLQSYVISLVCLCLCATMLMGTTMAWFTDDVIVENNEIYTGILKAELKLKVGEEWKPLGGENDPKVFDTGITWEPDHVEVRTLTVVNDGELAMKYRLTLTLDSEETVAANAAAALTEEQFKALAEQFVVYVKQGEHTSFTALTEENSEWDFVGNLYDVLTKEETVFHGQLDSKGEGNEEKTATYSIAVYMDDEADSAFMGQKLSFDVKLTAYQQSDPAFDSGTSEPDSGVSEPEEETPEENVTYTEITPENLSTITFESNTQYKLKGDFASANVSLCLPVGVENVVFDGSDATNINELIITQNGALIDNADAFEGDRSGKVIIQNFTVQSQINVYACKTEVEICQNTMEALMVYAGNVALNIHDNVIDANFEQHTVYRDAATTWGNANDYAVSLRIFDYDLKIDDNTITDSYSHAIGLNGYQETFTEASDNEIQSFTGNKITVNATEKTKRAALKIWADAVYAPQSSDHAVVNEASQKLITTILSAEANNTITVIDGYQHTKFCIYEASVNE